MAANVVLRFNDAELRRLLKSPSGAVAKDLLRRGRRVQNKAKQLCPRDTGTLVNSITVTPVTTGGEFSVHVGSNVEYAGFVETGTSRMRAQPYLEPALEAARG